MIKYFSEPAVSVVLAGISVVSLGTYVSFAAGLLAIIYTSMKICDWVYTKIKK